MLALLLRVTLRPRRQVVPADPAAASAACSSASADAGAGTFSLRLLLLLLLIGVLRHDELPSAPPALLGSLLLAARALGGVAVRSIGGAELVAGGRAVHAVAVGIFSATATAATAATAASDRLTAAVLRACAGNAGLLAAHRRGAIAIGGPFDAELAAHLLLGGGTLGANTVLSLAAARCRRAALLRRQIVGHRGRALHLGLDAVKHDVPRLGHGEAPVERARPDRIKVASHVEELAARGVHGNEKEAEDAGSGPRALKGDAAAARGGPVSAAAAAASAAIVSLGPALYAGVAVAVTLAITLAPALIARGFLSCRTVAAIEVPL